LATLVMDAATAFYKSPHGVVFDPHRPSYYATLAGIFAADLAPWPKSPPAGRLLAVTAAATAAVARIPRERRLRLRRAGLSLPSSLSVDSPSSSRDKG